MATIKVHEAKSSLSKLMQRASRGEEIIIARGETPVVRLVPVGAVQGRRQPGAFRGKFRVGRKFFALLPKAELAAWE